MGKKTWKRSKFQNTNLNGIKLSPGFYHIYPKHKSGKSKKRRPSERPRQHFIFARKDTRLINKFLLRHPTLILCAGTKKIDGKTDQCFFI